MTTLLTRAALAPILALTLLTSAAAEETRIWRQTDYEQFRKGAADGVSLSSDGRIRLAAAIEELHDAPTSYIWDLAVGPDGAVYAGIGPEARVVRISPDGEAEVVFETDAVEVHAIAIAADGALYAATNPAGKVFRIGADGDSEVLYDPGASAIWDLAIAPSGDLFIATGDRGEIHRVSADGEGAVFYATGETHVRALAIDAGGRLLAGTDPGGMVFRIEEQGGKARGFVLYESPKAELTALVVDDEGAIYAAGAGLKAAPSAAQSTPPAPAPSSGPAPNNSAPAAQRPAPLRGGSEIVRISPDGSPSPYWRSADEIVYALGFDSGGNLLAGTGGKGRIYRIEDDRLYWLERTLTSDQVTALTHGADGTVYAATSNVGKVYSVGPGAAERGELLSDTLDTEGFAQWGRLEYSGASQGIELSLRTGNVKRPGATWSEWSAAVARPDGANTDAPGARYGQWRLTLTSPQAEVAEIRQYYRPANRAPEITHLELTPPNFRLPPRSRTVTPVATISLPPLGANAARRNISNARTTMTKAPRWRGLRWRAVDPNNDELRARVSIRGEGESSATVIEEDLETDSLAFDASGFADGWYRLEVAVSDAESNPRGEELSADRQTELFLIDNTAPSISNLAATRSGEQIQLEFQATDAASRIREAAVSIDGGAWIEITPASGLFDSRELQFNIDLEAAGAKLVAVRVRDQLGNQTVEKAAVAQ